MIFIGLSSDPDPQALNQHVIYPIGELHTSKLPLHIEDNSLVLFPPVIPEELLSIRHITAVIQAVPPHLSCSSDVAVLHVVL